MEAYYRRGVLAIFEDYYLKIGRVLLRRRLAPLCAGAYACAPDSGLSAGLSIPAGPGAESSSQSTQVCCLFDAGRASRVQVYALEIT